LNLGFHLSGDWFRGLANRFEKDLNACGYFGFCRNAALANYCIFGLMVQSIVCKTYSIFFAVAAAVDGVLGSACTGKMLGLCTWFGLFSSDVNVWYRLGNLVWASWFRPSRGGCVIGIECFR
jgi:hypothetical protein